MLAGPNALRAGVVCACEMPLAAAQARREGSVDSTPVSGKSTLVRSRQTKHVSGSTAASGVVTAASERGQRLMEADGPSPQHAPAASIFTAEAPRSEPAGVKAARSGGRAAGEAGPGLRAWRGARTAGGDSRHGRLRGERAGPGWRRGRGAMAELRRRRRRVSQPRPPPRHTRTHRRGAMPPERKKREKYCTYPAT